MPELKNFPMVSQLADLNEIDRYYTCVPTSIAAALEWLTGKSFDGAAIKDEVYGPSYQGGTAASAYIDYCRRHGVTLWHMDGSGMTLVNDIKSQLALGHPVLITEKDPYSSNPGDSHVCCAYKCDANSITVMDPFIASSVTRSNQEWVSQLLFSQVWPLAGVQQQEEPIVLKIEQVSGYYVEEATEGRWYLKGPNADHHQNLFIGGDILKYYCVCTNVALNGFSQYGLPLAHEEKVVDTKSAVLQRFERGVIACDPDKELDSVPGITGNCYPGHIDKGPGQDSRIEPLQAEIQQLKQGGSNAQVQALENKLNQIEQLAKL